MPAGSYKKGMLQPTLSAFPGAVQTVGSRGPHIASHLDDNQGMNAIASSGRAAARRVAAAALLGLSVLASGCQSLLPESAAEAGITWKSFGEAKEAIERIVPYETTRNDLWAAGLDPQTTPSITILSYSDILQRFAAGSAMRPEDFDRGIRQCVGAGKKCVGYLLQLRRVTRERIGNFWLDSFNFRRETEIKGWSFNALILLVDDVVVYTLHGGQPGIHEHELVRNPLGPLQAWGEQAPRLLR